MKQVAGVGVLLLVAALLPWWGTILAKDIPQFRNIDEALMMYELIKQVKPSRIGGEEFQKIIRKRTICYDQATTPLERKLPCNISYVDSIIRIARENLKSVPQLGLFIRHVQYCPIVYSMCVGEHMDAETCVNIERQCIDYTLDKYWRGSPPHGSRE